MGMNKLDTSDVSIYDKISTTHKPQISLKKSMNSDIFNESRSLSRIEDNLLEWGKN